MFWFWPAVLALGLLCWYLLDWLVRLPKVGNHGNKFVFITGCDSGFGRELAIRLDGLGYPVFAGCLTQEGGKSLTEICSERLRMLNVDVASQESISAAYDDVNRLLPNDAHLWAVVNNAGITGQGAVTEMCTKDDYLQVCNVNLFGPIEVSRKFMPLLRKSRGRVVNMVSMAGRIACSFGPYSVSKFGMEAFSDVLRREMSRFGVKVCIIEPGFFKTPLLSTEGFNNMARTAFHRSSDEVQATYGYDYLEFFQTFVWLTVQHLPSEDTHKVVDAYVHAITSKHPRKRYIVGLDAWLAALPMSLAPAWFSDWLLGKVDAHAENLTRRYRQKNRS